MPHWSEIPVTKERIERAMDTLACFMMRLGEEGEQLLPLYERLETELSAMQAKEAKMALIRERARLWEEKHSAKGTHKRKSVRRK